MASICIYFKVHQPFRLRNYSIFEESSEYFDKSRNDAYCQKVSHACYLPANRLLLDLIKKYKGQFRISYCISGTVLEQFRLYVPEVLDSFVQLAATGCVEFLGQTHDHSLSYLYSHSEFAEQVQLHKHLIKDLFGQTPAVFCNTELFHHPQLPLWIEQIGGFKAVLTQGTGFTPGLIYRPVTCKRLKLLVKNEHLSDDVAVRFFDRLWNQWPLTAEKYAGWIHNTGQRDPVINLVMNYEILGEYQRQETGIFDFIKHLPQQILRFGANDFKTPSELTAVHQAVDVVDSAEFTDRPDREEGLALWTGNPMQANALDELYRLEDIVKAAKDKAILADWRKLQSAEHFYSMCTNWLEESQAQKFAYPYESPYDLYVSFMNVLDNLEQRCLHHLQEKEKSRRRLGRPIRTIPAISMNENAEAPCIAQGNKV